MDVDALLAIDGVEAVQVDDETVELLHTRPAGSETTDMIAEAKRAAGVDRIVGARRAKHRK